MLLAAIHFKKFLLVLIKESKKKLIVNDSYHFLQRDRVDDISPSDLIAGLMVLQQDEKKKWKGLLDDHFCPESRDGSVEDVNDDEEDYEEEAEAKNISPVRPKPWMTTQNALYYQKYAKATYGWPKYLMINGLPGAWNLAKWVCGNRYTFTLLFTKQCYRVVLDEFAVAVHVIVDFFYLYIF